MSQTEELLFFLSDGDAVKIAALRNTKLKTLYDFYILRRAQALNELLESIAHIKHNKET